VVIFEDMGGGGRYPYPKFVFALAGGWWNTNPRNAKRNLLIAATTIALGAFTVFRISSSRERRCTISNVPVPSQRWSKHTLEDDPHYYEKKALYAKTKKSFIERVWPDPSH
jgi:hypothetical protein